MRPVTAKSQQKSHAGPRGLSALSSSALNMSKEASLSVPEREFILEALREDRRLDGRTADEFRPLNISFGEEYGHVKLQLGKTRWVTIR